MATAVLEGVEAIETDELSALLLNVDLLFLPTASLRLALARGALVSLRWLGCASGPG